MSNANPIVVAIVQEALAEEIHSLEQMKSGEDRAPWVTNEQYATAVEECKDRIASMQHKLDDPTELSKWWNSLPEEVRHQLIEQ